MTSFSDTVQVPSHDAVISFCFIDSCGDQDAISNQLGLLVSQHATGISLLCRGFHNLRLTVSCSGDYLGLHSRSTWPSPSSRRVIRSGGLCLVERPPNLVVKSLPFADLVGVIDYHFRRPGQHVWCRYNNVSWWPWMNLYGWCMTIIIYDRPPKWRVRQWSKNHPISRMSTDICCLLDDTPTTGCELGPAGHLIRAVRMDDVEVIRKGTV